MSRVTALSFAALALACGSESGVGPGSFGGSSTTGGHGGRGGEQPDAQVLCSAHAQCDDGNPCAEHWCDVSTGHCRAAPIAGCVADYSIFEDDFETSAPVVDDLTLRDHKQGGGSWNVDDASACPVGLEQPLADDFEGHAEGTLRHGVGAWSTLELGGGSVQIVADPADASGQCLQLLGTTSPGSYAQASHGFTPQASGSVELRLRAPGTAKSKWLTLDEGHEPRVYLYFEDDGLVKVNEGGVKVTLAPYAANAWMSIRLDWSSDADAVDVTIDGASYTNLGTYQPIAGYLDRLRLRTASGTGLSFLVDDVVASGGEHAWGGAGASLRVGMPGASCEATASHGFSRKETGTLELDLMADSAASPRELSLGEARWADARFGSGSSRRIVLRLDPDGRVRYEDGSGALRELPTPVTWTAGQWAHVKLRWLAQQDSFDLWWDDMTTPKGTALPVARAIGTGLDDLEIRSLAPYDTGTLWIDNVRVSTFDVPTIVQATDLHVEGAAPNDELVSAAVRTWNGLVHPDAVVVSGDLSNGGAVDQLVAVHARLSESVCAIHPIAGNHDDGVVPPGSLDDYHAVVGQTQYSFDLATVHFAALNLAGHASGDNELLDADLGWLGDDLARAREQGCGGDGCATLVTFQHASPLVFADGNRRIAPESAALGLVDLLESERVLVDLAGHSHQCEMVARVGSVYHVVSHPLADPESYPAGFRLLAFDGTAWAQSFRLLRDGWPAVLVTWPPNRAGGCEDCGNDGCLAEAPSEVDFAGPTGGSVVSGMVPIRAKVFPPLAQRFEAESDPMLTTTGSWSSYGNGESPALSRGAGLVATASCDGSASVRFDFEGTGVVLVHSVGSDYGVLDVAIDGVDYPSLDLYGARYAPGRTSLLAAGLEAGAHQLVLSASGEKNAASSGCNALLDAFDVSLDAPLEAIVEIDGAEGPTLRYDQNGLYRGMWDATAVAPGRHEIAVRVPSGSSGSSYGRVVVEVAAP